MAKFSKIRLTAVLSLVLVTLLMITGCKFPHIVDSGADSVGSVAEGSGNLASQGVAVVSGDDIYYKHPLELQVYKLNLSTNETTKIGKDSFCVLKIDGSVYYLSYFLDEATQQSGFKMFKITENGDVEIFSDTEISYPQISGNYMYYLKSVPEFYSGYSSRVYRAEIAQGATPELVCDVLCNSFYVDGETLYYEDVVATALMSVSLESAIAITKNAPLPPNTERNSGELGATPIISDMVIGNLNKNNNILYFTDFSENQGEFCSYDFSTGKIAGFNTGIYANNYNIAGDYIYYTNFSDYSIYRMKLDGTEIEKVSPISNGQIIISEGKLIYVGISTNEATLGDRYIAICGADGTVIRDITFTEEYDLYREAEAEEEYYDDYAFDEELFEEFEIIE